MRLGRKVSVFVVSFLVATLALAQGNGEVNGTVTGASGSGVGGVSVVLNEVGSATLTDSSGSFSFKGGSRRHLLLSASLWGTTSPRKRVSR